MNRSGGSVRTGDALGPGGAGRTGGTRGPGGTGKALASGTGSSGWPSCAGRSGGSGNIQPGRSGGSGGAGCPCRACGAGDRTGRRTGGRAAPRRTAARGAAALRLLPPLPVRGFIMVHKRTPFPLGSWSCHTPAYAGGKESVPWSKLGVDRANCNCYSYSIN